MREPAGLAYLLARASDTLADSAEAPPRLRLDCLAVLARGISLGAPVPAWPREILDGTPDLRERELLEKIPRLLDATETLPPACLALVRQVLATILEGQRLDVERFGSARAGAPACLRDDAELEDYTWRVAGCVGEFWTHLGFTTLRDDFSRFEPPPMAAMGRRYGMALQLVNILRDFPRDLAAGRCYLPLEEPAEEESRMRVHARWLETAERWLADGHRYSARLRTRRLRLTSGLPALLAAETLEALRGASFEQLASHIKIPRWRVHALLLQAWLASGEGR